MKVALIGYGKMGKAIEEVLHERGHEVVARFTSDGIDQDLLSTADVAIEFTLPEAAVANMKQCFDLQVPVVVGTTGWQNQAEEIYQHCEKTFGAMLPASNFSLGVNIFFEINRQLARIMNSQKQYDLSVEEIHHTEKKDAPSGTAITLAEDILQEVDRKSEWELASHSNGEKLAIEAKREKDVHGTHIIKYASAIDDIEIKHVAHNRKGFALGAVLAAEFLQGKTGIYTMKDVLNI